MDSTAAPSTSGVVNGLRRRFLRLGRALLPVALLVCFARCGAPEIASQETSAPEASEEVVSPGVVSPGVVSLADVDPGQAETEAEEGDEASSSEVGQLSQELSAPCAPGSRACAGNTLQICFASGSFVLNTVCPAGCANGRCRECAPNSRRCVGNNLQTCDASGTVIITACPSGCSNGQCVVCSPNSRVCVGNTLRTCNASGTAAIQQTCARGCSNGACL